MQATKNSRISIGIVLCFIAVTNFNCKRDGADSFCNLQRASYSTVRNQEGIISYSAKYNRYAVSFSTTTPNNIDSQVVGLVCDLKPAFKTIGTKVIVAGNLKKFNAEENVTPETGGQYLSFLEIDSISIK